jgi:valyl-tRNA synthetase
VTTAVHDFWLDELCARYLEMIKRVVYNAEAKGDDTKSATPSATADRASALAILYTCLDWGLKLLHPMMPFVTEELFHRLPARPKGSAPENKSGSIMVERFPLTAECSHWISDTVEAEFKVLEDIAHSSRSSRAALGLTGKRVELYAQCGNDTLYNIIAANHLDLTTLAYASKVTAQHRGTDKPPHGCMSTVLSPELELLMPVAVCHITYYPTCPLPTFFHYLPYDVHF